MRIKTVQSSTSAALQGMKFLDAENETSQEEAYARNILDMTPPKSGQQISHVLPHTDMLAQRDLIGLYQSIEAALPNMDSRIVQFASCNKGEGATTIAAGLCALASGLYGHRTLLIDAYAGASSIGTARGAGIASLADVATGRAIATNAVALSPTVAMPFDYAYVTASHKDRDILAYHDKLRQILGSLCSQYRLIVLHTSNVLADPVGVSLSGLADGVVLVLEAERTRSPAAKKAIAQMSTKGANVIGLAFNKRHFYIPRWLYRRL